MQKVYLLLRNNQQTGPFNLEELIQFDLKPFDLIWIEGRSAGWYYPQEIPALQPHLPFLKQIPDGSTPAPVQASTVKPVQPAGPKKIFVSMPFNANKEEPAPNPTFASQPHYEPEKPAYQSSSLSAQEEAGTLKTTYAKSLEEAETDYTDWLYKKKTNKRTTASHKEIIIACLLAGTAFAGWFLLQPTDKATEPSLPQQTAQFSVQNELPADSAEEKSSTALVEKFSVNRKQKLNKNVVGEPEQKQPAVRPHPSEKQQTSTTDLPLQDETQTPVIKEADNTIDEEKKPEPVTTEAPKEKKKLKDKIADLFRKKPEEKKEEARPSEEENGERRSVRREAGSNLAQLVSVRFEIPNDWMMGIKGAKATLTNRSNEIIAKAIVEVVYYNDDNDVLDKRTISFSNIKSKQTQTISVPNHQTATRLEYKVVSVTGAGEPFARM